MGLKKENCLKKSEDFKRVWKRGKGFYDDFLFLKVLENNEKKGSRFGFLVTPKISKKAIERNKIKRKLREIIRKKINLMQKRVDAVIVAKKGIETKNFQEIERTIEKLFKKAKLWLL